ncbi:hypothetical protein GUJ93_ZPchr0002g24507 [Zizania palustris]|uniref:Uncharacterized protein n=1 Tax=Zizania palustris TaxID=103762 RepID=A0A8J5RY89_ZIZPA|nr:hypothetical protein GUJ93_ZPchr0002g24507 [Zizania palustris]
MGLAATPRAPDVGPVYGPDLLNLRPCLSLPFSLLGCFAPVASPPTPSRPRAHRRKPADLRSRIGLGF